MNFRLALTLSLLTTACRPKEPIPEASVEDSTTTVEVVDAPREEAEVKVEEPCPPGMRHVSGSLCKRIRYKCLKGRNNKQGMTCPTGCYVPFDDCQEWLPGSTECLPTKSVKRDGKWTLEPEYVSFDFCMDDYEWPNKAGEKPTVFITYHDAEKMCASVGKRICTSAEFTLACEGPDQLPTGYGWKIDGNVCNVDKVWRDWTKVRLRTPEGFSKIDQSEPIGSRPQCVSHYSVHDLTGNIDEWTKLDPIDRDMSRYPSQLKGGYYAYGANPYCRAHTDFHNPEFSFYQIGTRCCTEAKSQGEGDK